MDSKNTVTQLPAKNTTQRQVRVRINQELMEPRVGVASSAAKIRGWEKTLTLLEAGELSNSELDAIIAELPSAVSEHDAALSRVLLKVSKAMQRRLREIERERNLTFERLKLATAARRKAYAGRGLEGEKGSTEEK
jgi:hypothetical protein